MISGPTGLPAHQRILLKCQCILFSKLCFLVIVSWINSFWSWRDSAHSSPCDRRVGGGRKRGDVLGRFAFGLNGTEETTPARRQTFGKKLVKWKMFSLNFHTEMKTKYVWYWLLSVTRGPLIWASSPSAHPVFTKERGFEMFSPSKAIERKKHNSTVFIWTVMAAVKETLQHAARRSSAHHEAPLRATLHHGEEGLWLSLDTYQMFVDCFISFIPQDVFHPDKCPFFSIHSFYGGLLTWRCVP